MQSPVPSIALRQRFPEPIYIIDAQSPEDLCKGNSIGRGLYEALKSIRFPCEYHLTINNNELRKTLTDRLQGYINSFPIFQRPNPILHFCMHGDQQGVALPDGSGLTWVDFNQLILNAGSVMSNSNHIIQSKPRVSLASCHGIGFADWNNRQAAQCSAGSQYFWKPAYEWLVASKTAASQVDLTVGFLAFYNYYSKIKDINEAVEVLKTASQDDNFYYHLG